jgi:hypothetical protein
MNSELQGAADALRSLSAGPAKEAADTLARAFDDAGDRIAGSLGQAARSGELDFRRMSDAILRDIARVAAEALILRQAPGNSLSANFNFAPGTDDRGVMQESGAIAGLLARLVQGGGRFL